MRKPLRYGTQPSSAQKRRQQKDRLSGDIGLCSATTSKATSRNREIPRKSGSRKGTSYVPYPQRERIKRKFIAGESISRIAREESRNWETISKICKEADLLEHVKELRAKFYGALEGALVAAIEYAKNAKDGGWLAYEMLKDAGVIPQKNLRDQPTQAPSTPDPEESAVRKLAVTIVNDAIRRQRSFGLPLPELEEAEPASRA